MSGKSKRIFLDTTPLIYFLDNDENFGEKTCRILSALFEQNVKFVSSTITVAEYLVQPYRAGNEAMVEAFWKFVKDSQMILFPIGQSESVKAAEIRAAYRHFKLMDSLQLATACLNGCELFLTNDRQLKQFKEIKCVTVEEWNFEVIL